MSVASHLLIEARGRAALSQAELARRAGIPRSVLNAYERGRREPGVEALARLLTAAGFELRLERVGSLDAERADRIFGDALDLAEALPTRRRARLDYPKFPRRAG